MENERDPLIEAERRVGQVLVALGQGAGIIRISREAVDAVRERYLANFARLIHKEWGEGRDSWLYEGPNVLDRVRAGARLAANLAIAEGSMTIERSHVIDAATTVEKYHAGQWCPVARRAKNAEERPIH